MNINQWLQYDPEQVLIVQHVNPVTVKMMHHKVACMQRYFLHHSVKSCAISTDDTYLFLSAFLACCGAGVDVVLPASTADEFLATLTVDCWVGDFSKAISFDDNEGHEGSPELLTSDITVTLFTSGSSGAPKQIDRNLSQLIEEVKTLQHLWGAVVGQAMVAATVSHQHIYGLLFKLLWPLLRGASMLGPMLPYESSLAQRMKEGQTLVLVSSPAFLKRVCNNHDHQGQLLQVFSSGGLLTDEQHESAENCLAAPITQVYGSSETGGIAHRSLLQTWQLLPQVETNLKEGVLWVRSPYCFLPDWLCTQDAVEFNEDGFTLLERIDRIVKIEENRVSLTQVEQALIKHAWVSDAAVIKMTTKRQFLAAAIVLSAIGLKRLQDHGSSALKESIKSHLLSHLDAKVIPRRIRWVEAPIENSQGKRVLADLEAMLA